MQYAKYLREHPLPPITDEQMTEYRRLLSENRVGNSYYYKSCCDMYTATEQDGILEVVLYESGGKNKDELKPIYRHLYDGKAYYTYRISDKKQLTGAVSTYINYYSIYPLDKNTESVFERYFPDYCNPDIRTLIDKESKIRKINLERQHKKETDIIDARMVHCQKPPQEFYDWVENWVLAKSRYFFYTYSRKREQQGYCSHCKGEFTATVKHNDKTLCPHCHSLLTAQALGKVTAYEIRDESTAIYVEPIIENGVPVLCERSFFLMQVISHHKEGPDKIKINVYMYEQSRFFYHAETLNDIAFDHSNESYYYYTAFKQTGKRRWCNGSTSYISGSISGYIWPGNLLEIGSRINGIKNVELTAIVPHIKIRFNRLCERLEKYPLIENLVKQGLYKIANTVVKDCIYTSYELCKLADLKQRSPSAALGVDKITLAKMGDISDKGYILYRKMSAIKPIDVTTLKRYIGYELEQFTTNITYLQKQYNIGAVRLINYLEKQKKITRLKVSAIFEIYFDYLSMANDIRMPMTESVLWPQNVKVEHDRLMEIDVNNKKYGKQSKLLKKRVALLNSLFYDNGEFCIKPLSTPYEFICESAKLSHCVKTYIDRCAEGKTNIFGIRRSDCPDEPYFTLTLTNEGKPTTNLGLRNCSAPDKVKKFVKEWERKVIKPQLKELIKNLSA